MIDEEITFFSDWAKMRDCLPDIDEIEIGALSLQLRRMLIDGNPLVYIVNKKHCKKICFPALSPAEFRLSKRAILYCFPKNIYSDVASLSIKLEDFLSQKILEIDETPLTIIQVIKLVANNLGGVHFDHKAAAQEAQFDLRKDTTVQALRLAIYHIARATSAALSELASLCSPFPNYSQFLGHYSAGDERVSFLEFESQHWMEVKYPENTLTRSISVLSVLEPLPQKHKRAFLFSFEFRDMSSFDISLTNDGDFRVCYSKGNKKLELFLDTSRKIRPIGKQVYINASIESKALTVALGIEVQGRTKAETFEYPINELDLKRFVIGARKNGKLGARFLEKETCILSTTDPPVQESIIKYFKYRYLK